MKALCLGAIFVMASLSAVFVVEDDVTIKGVHLCCGSCVDGVKDALADIDGVSKPACDQNTKVVSFKVANDEAAAKAIQALADGGFYGTAKQGSKDLKFPDAGARKDVKSAKMKFSGVHLCCRACVKGAHDALKDVKGVSAIDVDREAGTVTISGTDIVQTDALAAFNKAGFYGKVSE